MWTVDGCSSALEAPWIFYNAHVYPDQGPQPLLLLVTGQILQATSVMLLSSRVTVPGCVGFCTLNLCIPSHSVCFSSGPVLLNPTLRRTQECSGNPWRGCWGWGSANEKSSQKCICAQYTNSCSFGGKSNSSVLWNVDSLYLTVEFVCFLFFSLNCIFLKEINL
jgi:hypothetical protein